jgi:hypothetical protein
MRAFWQGNRFVRLSHGDSMKSETLALSVILILCTGASAQTAHPAGNATYYAVDPSSSIDIVAQINALTARCGASCVIHVPAGKFTTRSSVPITLHAGQSLIGDGEQLTIISGNVAKMIVWHATSNSDFFPPAGKISDMEIHCGPDTTECIDTGDLVQAHLERLVVDGATSGDCIAITNHLHWFERSAFINVTVGSPGAISERCAVGIHLRAPAGGTNSYGYAYWPSIYQNSSSSGVQVDAPDLLYNVSYLGIQSNQDAGFALVAGGAVTASFLALTGEGNGGGIHVLKGGTVRGCGSFLSQLHQLYVVDGANDDTHMPLDLTDCGFGSPTTIPNYLGEGVAHFTPQILHHSSTGEVNAGLFFSDNGNRTGGPAMLFTNGGHYSIGTKQLYDTIGGYNALWWIDQTGSSVQKGSVTGTNVKSGEQVVAYTATPAFSAAAQSNIITLSGNLSGFTLAAGSPGQAMTLIFCQSERGGATVASPRNVRGLGEVGTAPSRCSSQSFVYSANRNAWMATAPMVTNE